MPVASVTGAITSFIGNHGLYAVFALMALDAVFPAASELVMAYAGALAAGAFAGQHVVLVGDRISSAAWAFVAMALSGTIGYTLGSLVGWGIGALGGRPLLERHGRFLHVSPENLARAERFVVRFGDAAVFLGRLTPVVRSFISIPAGVFRCRPGRYSGLTLAGSAVWCFALAGVGFGVGRSYGNFHRGFRYADYVVVGALVALAALALVRRRRSSRLAPRVEDPAR